MAWSGLPLKAYDYALVYDYAFAVLVCNVFKDEPVRYISEVWLDLASSFLLHYSHSEVKQAQFSIEMSTTLATRIVHACES